MQAENVIGVQMKAGASALALAAGADPILNKKQTATFAGLSVSTIDRLRERKQFPEPLGLSARRVGWRLSDVQAWVASRVKR